jgi:hypothetical protein
MMATIAELRRELQQILSVERDLIYQAENATASGEYRRLREVADELVKMMERRAELRAALLEAQARERAAQEPEKSARTASDLSADTWRHLR